MRQHMATAAHFSETERIHHFTFRGFVDIFRGQVNDFINVEIAGKLDFTHFG